MLGMFGKSAGNGLVDTRTDEEKQRELLGLNPFAPRPRMPLGSPMIDPQSQSAIDQYASMPAQAAPERWIDGGKFSGKDALGLALGAIGDAFSRNAGGEAVVAPMLFQGMADSRKAKEAAARAQAERADWVWKQQYQKQNETKPSYRWESNDGSLMELGPDGQPRVAYKDPTPKLNFIPDGRGGGRWVPLPGTGISAPQPGPSRLAGGASPTLGAIEDGYQFMGGDPANPSSWKPVGGGSGNAAGGFPSNRIPSGNPLQRPW